MAGSVILAVDQSTAGTKAVVFDRNASIRGKVLLDHKQYYPQPGWVEHDPAEILANTESAMEQALQAAGLHWSDVAAIGLSNQRETVLLWDRATGNAVHNAIVWQDGRAAALCQALEPEYDYLRHITGLEPSPFFAAPKVAWMLQEYPELKERAQTGELAMGTVDSYLLWQLTGGQKHCTDVTNASRTLLLNLEKVQWDDRAFEIFDIPKSLAPEIIMSDACNTVTHGCQRIPDGIPIAAMLGDSHAALFGQCCHNPGSAKVTLGTGSSVMMNTGSEVVRSRHGLVASVAYGQGNELHYCLEGNINTTGGIIKWFCEQLGILSKPAEAGTVAMSIPGNDGVYLVPALAGLAAPHWQPDARASFVGMTSGTTRAHLVRAGEEAIAYQITDVLRAMEQDTGEKLSVLRADGGPGRDPFLMPFQAGMLGCRVDVAGIEEISALGAAFCAGLAVGFWPSRDALSDLRPVGALWEPSMDTAEANRFYQGWKAALKQVIG